MYLNKDMSPTVRIACSRHLTSCRECAKLLDELEADSLFVEQLRSSINTLEKAANIAKSVKTPESLIFIAKKQERYS
jgi:anti-sigma factor RsiW